jgi:hypothetical protein
MECTVADKGRTVQIAASSTLTKNSSCKAYCSYKTAKGATGKLDCDGTVPAKAKQVVFCHHFDADTTFTITDKGSFRCH